MANEELPLVWASLPPDEWCHPECHAKYAAKDRFAQGVIGGHICFKNGRWQVPEQGCPPLVNRDGSPFVGQAIAAVLGHAQSTPVPPQRPWTNEELRHRTSKLGLLDALTTEPLDVEPFIERRIADHIAWRDIRGNITDKTEVDQTALFWLQSFVWTLEDILKRYRLERLETSIGKAREGE